MHVDQIRTAVLLEGLQGTGQTLREMAAFVRKDAGSVALRRHALEIAGRCGGHDFDCEIRALFHYCRDRIVYRKDPVGREWVQDAARTIGVFGSGDCDDKVVCLATLLATLGHKSRFVVVGKRPDQFTHVYLEAQTKDGGWLPLDPTPERAPAGWEARGMHRETFDIFESDNRGGLLIVAAAALLLWGFLR